MSNVIPFLRYEDAPAALRWLEQAFGFETKTVHKSDDGGVDHAVMAVGAGRIMLSSAKAGGESLGVKLPARLGGVSQGTYVSVRDVDAHYARAKAAGARIVYELTDQPYGSREYGAYDPEGYLWCFGTYEP